MPAENHTTLTPDTPVRYLKGVGPKTAERFEKLGIVTLADLLCHYPRRYIDFTKPYSIAEAPTDVECVVRAEVFAKPGGRILPGGRRMERITAGDDVSSLEITWFNNPYAAQKLQLGQEYYFQGIVTGGMLRRQMVNPQVRTAEQIKASPFEAVYPQTEGLTSNAIAKCVRQLLPHAELLPDPLPPEMLAKYRLLSKADAVRAIHCPATEEQAYAARRRLIYEELLVLQLGIGRMKTGVPLPPVRPCSLPTRPCSGPACPSPHRCPAPGRERDSGRHGGRDFHEPPFAGRCGQRQNAGGGCRHLGLHSGGVSGRAAGPDRNSGHPARRGPEPDACPFGMRVALLTGGMKAAARRTTPCRHPERRSRPCGGHPRHPQRRRRICPAWSCRDRRAAPLWGTAARNAGRKGRESASAGDERNAHSPHAGPAHLRRFGHLHSGRAAAGPHTGQDPLHHRQKRRDLYHFLDQEIGRGRQVYLVCPAIEDTPDGGLNAVKSYYEDIAKALLPERRVGLMHGKLKPKEKAAVMEDFKAGRLDALVSTTVIEVGVDVPNASVMVIENAERYGLSALHQLRGRVGRGAAESWCFLVSDNQSENVQKRLKFLCSTTDGFAVAQYDLETRGPGDFFGSRQHGLPTLQIADLMNDTRTLHAAQAEAVAMLADDPLLEAPEHALLEQQVQQMFEKAGAMN